MIHTTENFFNKVADEIRGRYFADVKYYRDSEKCTAATYAIECFNNGQLTYRTFIGRLAKACDANNATIHNLVEKYIISFGEYRYKPRRLCSQSKTIQPIKTNYNDK